MLHLYVGLSLHISREVLPFHGAQTLVPFGIRSLELHVRRRTRSGKDCDPIAQDIALSERSMPVSFGKLVRIEILPRGLAATNQEEMVRPERGRIRRSNRPVDDHCPRDSQRVDGRAEGDALLRPINQDMG